MVKKRSANSKNISFFSFLGLLIIITSFIIIWLFRSHQKPEQFLLQTEPIPGCNQACNSNQGWQRYGGTDNSANWFTLNDFPVQSGHIDAYTVKLADNSEVHPGKLMQVVHSGQDVYYRYPFVDNDNAWHKINDWIDKTGPADLAGADHIDAMSTRLGSMDDTYPGEQMEIIHVGKDAYYRYPFVDDSGNDGRGWYKINNWIDHMGPTDLAGADHIDAMDVRKADDEEEHPNEFKETITVNRKMYYRYPFYEQDNSWHQVMSPNNEDWLTATGMPDNINRVDAYASYWGGSGEPYPNKIRQIVFIDENAYERYPWFQTNCPSPLNCLCTDGSLNCGHANLSCRQVLCADDAECDCVDEPVATNTPATTTTPAATNTPGPNATITPSPTPTPSSPPTDNLTEKIIFSQDKASGERHIMMMDADGTNPEIINLDPNASFVHLSPNGKYICYGKQNSEQKHDLWVANSDGSNPHQIVDVASEWMIYANFSPDNNKLVYMQKKIVEGIEQYWLYTVNADGTENALLTDGVDPYWHENGLIYYSAWSDVTHSSDIFSIRPDGTEKTRLYGTDEHDSFLLKCDDKMVFTANIGTAQAKVYQMSLDGENVALITDEPANLQAAKACSPNGSKILLEAGLDEDYSRQLYTVNIDGTDLVQLTDNNIHYGEDWGMIPIATGYCGDNYCDPQLGEDDYMAASWCYQDCCPDLSPAKGDLDQNCMVNTLDWGIMRSHWTPASQLFFEPLFK